MSRVFCIRNILEGMPVRASKQLNGPFYQLLSAHPIRVSLFKTGLIIAIILFFGKNIYISFTPKSLLTKNFKLIKDHYDL